MSIESTSPGHGRGFHRGLATEQTEPSGLFAADRLSDDNLLMAENIDTDVHHVVRTPGIRPGSVIDDRYRVIERLARGGMSWVFLAEQTNIRRRVAIKVIRKRYSEDEVINARVRREARAMAHIDHPNIVAVHDVGTTVGGQAYIVMELVKGESLSDVLRDQDVLELDRAFRLLLQIARALAAVHGHGMVHRDLKPGNVLLGRTENGIEQAKVADFGLAKVLRDRTGLESFRTRAGTILGTPEYMAPEQVQGAAVDHRADIYSFGCMAFEMLTGAPPFVGDEMTVLYKHLHDLPPPLMSNQRCARGGEAIGELIGRCLAKDPDLRFPDAVQLYAALLGAADECGLARGKLRLVESLQHDPAYVAIHGKRRARLKRATGPRVERALALTTAVVLAATLGLAVERYLVNPAPEKPSVAATEALLVNTTPRGATVLVDGREVGVTPVAVPEVGSGRYQLELRLAGYQSVQRVLSLDGESPRLVDVELSAPHVDVPIKTSPAGARVFVDGAPIESVSPATIPVEPSEFYQVRVEKDGFAPAIYNVTPEHRGAIELDLEPERAAVGYLWVDSREPAEVYIDGAPSGHVAPSVGIRMRVGKHKIQLRDSTGRLSRPATVHVRKGSHAHLTLTVDERGE